MAGDDDTGPDREDPGHRIHADVSDARLAELLRGHTTTAYPALQELRARHHAHVLKYARLCAPDDALARQLAAEAVTSAARRTARGLDPGLPWRHHLLLLAAKTAGTWATDERAAGLDPALLLLLRSTGPDGPVSPMLTAFSSLPDRTQGLIWYGIVEEEPPARTAALLGLTPEDVTYGTGPALQQLARACLRTRLAASDDPDCPDFGRLIEESVRPDNPRDSADLQAHRARCPHCAAAHAELSALRDTRARPSRKGCCRGAGRRTPVARRKGGRRPSGPSGHGRGGPGSPARTGVRWFWCRRRSGWRSCRWCCSWWPRRARRRGTRPARA
ncbi:hypothetical protein ACE6JH_14365 [Streptomyces nigra]